MTNKFSALKDRFSRMYQGDQTLREICAELGINLLTAYEWRKRLHLAPRRERRASPASWMDERNIQSRSPREILSSVAEPLGLSPRDIEFILVRFEKLKSKGLHRGRAQIQLILTGAYLYVRWEASHRKPISPKNFLRICTKSKFRLDRRTLLMHCRLFQEAGLYPTAHLKPQELLERMWNSLKQEFDLTDQVKFDALQLISELKLIARTPEVAVAGCLYAAALRCRHLGHSVGVVTQKELADSLGITEVSVRNVWNLISSSIPDFRNHSQNRVIASEPENTQARLDNWSDRNKGILVSEVEGHIGGYCANCGRCTLHDREATHFVLFSADQSKPDSVLVSAVCEEGRQYHASSPNMHNARGFVPITRVLFAEIRAKFPKIEGEIVSSDDVRRKDAAQFILSSQERMMGGTNH